MSDGAAAPYRGGGGAGAALVVRYGCITSWVALGALLVLGAAFAWVISTEPLDQALRTGSGALVFLALVVLARFPLITLRARVEGGHLVVSGRRWPGPETIWSCMLAEAMRFEEQTLQKPLAPGKSTKNLFYRRIALRTRDDQVLGLTHVAYPSAQWPHPQVVARLNDWLTSQTNDRGEA